MCPCRHASHAAAAACVESNKHRAQPASFSSSTNHGWLRERRHEAWLLIGVACRHVGAPACQRRGWGGGTGARVRTLTCGMRAVSNPCHGSCRGIPSLTPRGGGSGGGGAGQPSGLDADTEEKRREGQRGIGRRGWPRRIWERREGLQLCDSSRRRSLQAHATPAVGRRAIAAPAPARARSPMPCPSPARASAPGTSGAVPEAGQGLRTGGSPAAAPSTPPPDLARDALQPGYSRVPASCA